MEFAICPSCDEANPGAAQKCQKCGADLTEPVAVPAAPIAVAALEPEPSVEPPVADLPPELATKVKELEDGLVKNPNARALYVRLSKLYEDAGRKDLAIQVFERSLAVDPANAYAKHRLHILSGAAAAPMPEVFQPTAPPARRPPSRRVVIAAAAVGILAIGVVVKWLVFPSTRRLVGVEYNATSPRWSPDGDRLAFLGTKGGHTAIHVYDLRKKTVREVARLDDAWGAQAYAWSPDGRRIAYVSAAQGEDVWGEAVYVLDVDSGKSTGVAMGTEPTWSPDGMSLALLCQGTATDEGYDPGGLCVVNIISGDIRRLPVQGGTRARFSPRDATIAFEVPAASEPAATDAGSGVVRAPGEELGDIAIAAQSGARHNMAGASAGLAREMEARKASNKGDGNGSGARSEPADIFVVGAGGGAPRRLTNDGRSSSPVWSPDGNKILYLHAPAPSNPVQIWMMNVDGTEQQVVYSGTVSAWDAGGIVLTPDSRRVIFPAPVGGASEGVARVMTGEAPIDLFVARVGVATATRLENKHPFKQRFSLSPDGRTIAYETRREGKSELWLMSP